MSYFTTPETYRDVLNFLEIAKKGRAKGIFFAQQKRVDLDIDFLLHEQISSFYPDQHEGKL